MAKISAHWKVWGLLLHLYQPYRLRGGIVYTHTVSIAIGWRKDSSCKSERVDSRISGSNRGWHRPDTLWRGWWCLLLWFVYSSKEYLLLLPVHGWITVASISKFGAAEGTSQVTSFCGSDDHLHLPIPISTSSLISHKSTLTSWPPKMANSSPVNEPKLPDRELLALARFRADREYQHWYRVGLRFCHYYLCINPYAPLPQIPLGAVQDCGNKSLAIYCTGETFDCRQVVGRRCRHAERNVVDVGPPRSASVLQNTATLSSAHNVLRLSSSLARRGKSAAYQDFNYSRA